MLWRLPRAEAGSASVVLSYRGVAFDRAKPRNRERVNSLAGSGQLRVLLGTNLKQIADGSVAMEQAGGRLIKVRNDAVIVNAGGVLPTEFLRTMGISVETKYGTA